MTDLDRMAMLKDFLGQNPNDSFARYGLALEYRKLGQLDHALAEFSTLLQKDPDYTAGYQMAAQTLVEAGRIDDAREMLADGIACARRTGNHHAMSEMEAMMEELKA